PKQAGGRFRNKPELGEGCREGRATRCDNIVAVQQHGCAYANGKAIDSREERFRMAHQRVEKFDGGGFEPTFGPPLKVGNVATGAESARSACKYDTADRIVRLGFAQRARYLRVH